MIQPSVHRIIVHAGSLFHFNSVSYLGSPTTDPQITAGLAAPPTANGAATGEGEGAGGGGAMPIPPPAEASPKSKGKKAKDPMAEEDEIVRLVERLCCSMYQKDAKEELLKKVRAESRY